MRLLNEVEVCFLLSIAFHAGLIGSSILSVSNPQADPFEVEFEVIEEILPGRYLVADEKKIEKDSAPVVPKEEVVEEISDQIEPSPPQMSEELKKSLLRYQDSVKQRIQEEKRYPRAALRLKKEGSARVFFILLPSGTIKDIRLMATSGVAELDREALDSVRRASPFRPFPQGLHEQEMGFEIDIAFMIGRS